MIARRLLISFGLVLICSILVTGQNDTLSTRHTKYINEIVINAPVYIQKQERWPGAVSMIDSLQILSGNSYQLSEQINTVPGVIMQQGTMSTNRITIRGVGSRTPYESNRIKAYWGEMPLTNGDGVTSIEDLSLSDISALQVLKGPSSALYGGGLGGVIFIDPWSSLLAKNTMKFKSEYGSFSTLSNQLDVGFKLNQTGLYTFSIGQLHTYGWRENSEFDRYNFTIKVKQSVGKSYLHFLYNFRYLNGQIPSSIDSTNFFEDPKKAAYTWKAIKGYEESNKHLANLGFSSPISSKANNVLNLFYNYSDLNELRPFNRLDETRSGLGLRNKFTYINNGFRTDVGAELMWEQNDLSFYSVDAESKDELLNTNEINRSYINVFALIEYQLNDKWTFQGSGNLNRTFYSTIDDNSGEKYVHRYKWVVSPRLGINYNFYRQMYLYGSIGHGFSAPSVEEAQMPDASFNADINAEEGMNVDFGYRFISSDNQTRLDLTLYWMSLKNLLVTKRESDAVFYGVNAGSTDHKGLEFSFNQILFEIENYRQFDLSVGYFTSLNEFREFNDEGTDFSGNKLPGIPDYSLALDGHFYLKPFHLYANFKSFGRQYLNDANTKSYHGYNKTGAKLAIDLIIRNVKINLYLGADNLFDTHYASMVLINAPSFGNNKPRYYYPGLPFNVYGGMSLRF